MAIIPSIFWEQRNPDDLIYKYPSHEITLGSVLTVNDSQEACFFRNGTLYDTFRGGRHVLSSANLPLLNKVINLPSGGETTFFAEVWFVSLTERRNMFWGTGGLRIIDPYFEIPIKLYGRGGYGFRISDSALFLRKFVGTMQYASLELIEEQFRISVVESVRITISKFMKEENVNINELGAEYKRLGIATSRELQDAFDEYGVTLLNFNYEDISFDEEDPGYQKVLDGIAEQTRLRKLGVNYMQDRQIDIAHAAASNTGAGTMMGVGMGFGVGQAMGGMVNSAIQQSGIASSFMSAPPPPPPACYYVAQNGQATGPFDYERLRQMAGSGILTGGTLICKVGSTQWINAATDPMIANLFAVAAPPPPPPVL